MKKHFFLILLALLPISVTAYTLNRVSVHDPSIVWEPNSKTYYIFGSFRKVAKTTDMMNWTEVALGKDPNDDPNWAVGVPWKTSTSDNAMSADAFSTPAVTKVMVLIVDDTELAWGNTVDFLLGLKMPSAVCELLDVAWKVFWRVTDFKGDFFRLQKKGRIIRTRFSCAFFCPRIGRNEMEIIHGDVVFIDFFGVVAVRDEQDVALEVLLNNEPRSAAESQAFALSDGIEPKATVCANLMPSFNLTDVTWLFAKVCLDVVAEVNIAQEANALRVFPLGVEQVCLLGNQAYLMFP